MVAEEDPAAPAIAPSRLFPLWRRIFAPSGVLIGTNLLTSVLRIGNTMVLTRLLAPEDFGLAGIIGSIFFAMGMLTDAGSEAYIIRHERGGEREFIDAVWTIHLIRGLGNSLLVLLLAGPVAHALTKPQLAPLLAVAGLTFALDGVSSLSLLTTLRRRMVNRLSAIDFGCFLIQLATGLIGAWFLRNAWALVIAQVMGATAKAIASYLVFPDSRQMVRFDRPVAVDLWRFSRVIAMSSLLTLAISQIDKLVLARFFSLAEFGAYAIATGLAAAPVAIVHLYVARIFYPAAAEAWRTAPEEMRARHYALRGLVFYGYLFAAGGLAGVAPLLIRILYDPRYAAAGAFLGLLAIGTGLSMLTRVSNDLLVAIGRVRTTLVNNILRIAWLAIVGIGGFMLFGAIGMVLALATVELPPYLFSNLTLYRSGLLDLPREIAALAIWGVGAGVGWGMAQAAALLLP